MEKPLLVFLDLWFDCPRVSSEKIKIVSLEKKEFKDIKDLLFLKLFYNCLSPLACIPSDQK
jgi:hypothetical protein